MKKLYTIFGAALMAMTASAAGFNWSNLQAGSFAGQQDVASLAINSNTIERLATEHQATTKLNGPRKTEIISEQPAGTVKYYNRAGQAFYVNSSSLYEDTQEGLMEIVYAEDGNTVYLKNPICYFATDTYVKGTLEGNTISVQLPQTLYTWTAYGYGAELSFVNITRNDDGQVEKTSDVVKDTENLVATYTIDGTTITLNGTDANHALAAVWDDDNTWTGRGDYNSVYTETVLEDLVTPPSGIEPVQYYYTGTYYTGSSSVKLNTTVNVVKSGNEIYIQGLATGNVGENDVLPQAWVKGTIEGTTVTIPTGQYIGLYGSNMMYLVGVTGNEVTDFTFTFDEEANTYTLNNTFYVNGKKDEVYYYLRHDAGNIISFEKPAEPEVVVAPEGLETETYTFTSQELKFQEDENGENQPVYNDVTMFVQVGFDNNDVFIQGLCEELPEAWVKGTLENGKVTLPTGQYFGTYSFSFWGTTYDYPHYLLGYGALGIQDAVLNYDAAAGEFTTEDYLIDNENTSSLSYYHIYTNNKLAKINEVAGKPANPEIVSFTPYESYGYARLNCNIPTVDTEGRQMNPAKMYYVLYSDINGLIEEITLVPDEYRNLTEEMTWIPYLFSDDYDIYAGADPIYLNQANVFDFNRIGVQTIYLGGIEDPRNVAKVEANDYSSDIAWFTIKDYTAVDGISSAKTVVAERYYNIAGQQSNKAFAGVNIVVRTYSDGTTETVKVLK